MIKSGACEAYDIYNEEVEEEEEEEEQEMKR